MNTRVQIADLLNGQGPAGTPCLVLDVDRVRANVETVRSSFQPLRPQIYYSIKASAEPSVLTAVGEMGCGFDIASIGELEWLRQANVFTSEVCFSSTVKIPSHITEAHRQGVQLYAFDSQDEVLKLARLAPGCKVILRLEVPHMGSRWPLAGKFGALASDAVPLLRLAREHGLDPHGLTFHVGSQCERIDSWLEALSIVRRVWNDADDRGIELKMLNIGGGLPAQYTEEVPSATEIGHEVSRYAIRAFGQATTYVVEPGRFIVADAGTMIATVVGKATRKGRPWIYVDLSIYAGLLEVTGGWSYPIVTNKDHLPKKRATLAGPTCDSTDIIALDVELPELEVGDRLAFLTAGAYTTAYQAYNGFSFPRVLTVRSNRAVAPVA